MSFQSVWPALLAAALCGSGYAQSPCSIETVRGVWVHSTGVATLTTAVPGSAQPVAVPGASLGMYVIDEQGGMHGWSNSMLSGEYSDATATGSIEVKPDCTGTIRVRVTIAGAPVPAPGEAVSRVFVTDGGNEMRAMTVAGVFGRHTGTEVYRRVVRNSNAMPQCTAATVRGTYGTAVDALLLAAMLGQAQPAGLPYSGIGAFSMDGRGGVTGSGASSVAGNLSQWETHECRVEVFADCTGFTTCRIKAKGAVAPMPGEAVDKLVILNDGDEIRSLTIRGQSGRSIAPGVWKRLSKEPGAVGW